MRLPIPKNLHRMVEFEHFSIQIYFKNHRKDMHSIFVF